jgi:hypothetical protein
MGVVHTVAGAFLRILGLALPRGAIGNQRARLSFLGGDRTGNRAGDVVFVHGLSGDADLTWRVGDGKRHWCEWFLEDREDIAFWTFGYPVSASEWTGTAMPLEYRAINTLDILAGEGIGQKPICFIAHSLGGLLVKQMLHATLTGTVREYKAIGSLTCGIVFLATPHHGTVIANVASYFGAVLRSTVSVSELRVHEPRLVSLNEWFRNNVTELRIKIKVFCETRETYGVLVVDCNSANPFVEGVSPVPVDANHLDICHPEDKGFHTYRQTLNPLNDVLPSGTAGNAGSESQNDNVLQREGILWRALIAARTRAELERVCLDAMNFQSQHPAYPGAQRLLTAALEAKKRTPQFLEESRQGPRLGRAAAATL